MYYALKYIPTNRWLCYYGRLKEHFNSAEVVQFPSEKFAEEFAMTLEGHWKPYGPFPLYNEFRKHELWHDFYSDFWTPQVETMCESDLYLTFLEWLGSVEE